MHPDHNSGLVSQARKMVSIAAKVNGANASIGGIEKPASYAGKRGFRRVATRERPPEGSEPETGRNTL